MSDRGVQAQGELRFLSRSFGSGRTAGEYMPSDSKYDDDRAALNVEHRHRWTNRLSTDTRFEWVSDAEYFQDLGAGLSQTSRTHLPRRFDADYRGDGWSALLRLEDFQTVDRTIPRQDRPYASLPQIRIRTDGSERDRTLNFSVAADLAYFERRSSTTGLRAHLEPSISYPVHTGGALRSTEGDVASHGVQSGPSRGRPLGFRGRLSVEAAVELQSRRRRLIRTSLRNPRPGH